MREPDIGVVGRRALSDPPPDVHPEVDASIGLRADAL
jgi:hypothetical protein